MALYFCNFIRILNKKAVEENEEKGLQIGTGPYKLVEYKSNDEIKMEKFNNYYNKDTIKYSPKTIIFKINKNNDTNLQQVENGSLDACLDYPSHKIQIIKDKLSHSVEVVGK
ncbi:ABC transporter substrate-binding protein [Areca yellow leaf disease phytoplasma]|uniref:ABC transporter substrate-binding protein n=1 Tax=Areca yellow leaf disease phytoplasma TaxID=927614 RepID=UPI0035B5201C